MRNDEAAIARHGSMGPDLSTSPFTSKDHELNGTEPPGVQCNTRPSTNIYGGHSHLSAATARRTLLGLAQLILQNFIGSLQR